MSRLRLVGTSIDGPTQYRRASTRARLFIDLLIYGNEESGWEPLGVDDANAQAGFKGKSRNVASVRRHNYAPAIDWLKDRLSKKAADGRQRSIQRVTAYAEANLADVVPKDLDFSDPEWWEKIPKGLKKSLSKFTIDKDGAVKLELEPRMAAEARLAKLEGWDRPAKLDVKVDDGLSLTERVALAIGGSDGDRLLVALSLGKDKDDSP